jgi:hypothetical protein
MPKNMPSSLALCSPDSDAMAVAQPIIYFYPPSSLSRVTVQLSLSPSWRFLSSSKTTINPVEYEPGQFLSWVVAAEPDGTLINKRTGKKGTHLNWEAM